jgi:hypothetical protein
MSHVTSHMTHRSLDHCYLFPCVWGFLIYKYGLLHLLCSVASPQPNNPTESLLKLLTIRLSRDLIARGYEPGSRLLLQYESTLEYL